ncbi:MAG: hypothetical protein ABI895_25355, partial [Deltaproteobacteria bacterium]
QAPAPVIAVSGGLSGDGSSLSPLAVSLAGDGSASSVARSDHLHAASELSSGALASGVTIAGAQVSSAVSDSNQLGGTPAAQFALLSDLGGGPWSSCGTLSDFNTACENPAFPTLEYQYAISFNSWEPMPVQCTGFNVGRRVYNALPYLINSDDPSQTMSWGGFLFYVGTNAADDDSCTSGTWRHRYWSLGANNSVTATASNGCLNPIVYCRRR